MCPDARLMLVLWNVFLDSGNNAMTPKGFSLGRDSVVQKPSSASIVVRRSSTSTSGAPSATWPREPAPALVLETEQAHVVGSGVAAVERWRQFNGVRRNEGRTSSEKRAMRWDINTDPVDRGRYCKESAQAILDGPARGPSLRPGPGLIVVYRLRPLVYNPLEQRLIEPDRPSSVYGVTWLQVYSYYNTHSSRDRWPVKSFVRVPMLVDSANLVFGIYLTYDLVVTNFGDYRATNVSSPWSRAPTVTNFCPPLFMHMKPVILESFVQHFYAYRIYCLGWRSPYLPIAIVLHIAFNTQTVASFRNVYSSFDACGLQSLITVLCDVLITVGMVYTLMSNRTHVRRTNNVLNLLAIYAVNCGILHLMFAIACVVLFATYPNALIYAASFFIMVRLSLCAFMSILNSRDHLRETLDGPGGVVVVTLTKTTLPR
ncbi:hypothetical protein EDB92DRAFT_1815750 [Lactarius akahatsu]|uniref:DUF6534 domain-containing protein n=1 Tax=Lactarius akahatsu TaxID=416441 RepID=A0AAD4LI57_9AGAM|nr:hypothetical protein EDB92DRAFT_1815750 [Lactarius akahatsu]